ncbi:MAG: DNA topoisomerase VI subunit B [Phycisphaerales bacterium]|nr:DNA topoisomerase VI subunit B [Phycisphaerales bacterium]
MTDTPRRKRPSSKAKGAPADSPGGKPARATAETMAAKQREISVSEFFAKNRHLLGFDNPRKALLTTVKEAVDNSLDACEEAGILPDLEVRIEELVAPPSPTKPGRYRITILDNGPGIVRRQIENIFGKLLYGSKFHRLKMSRGQQGIGISAAGMYGLMTTGRPMLITTRSKKGKPAHHLELAMDTSKNKPEVTVDIETEEFPDTSSGTGTRVVIELEGRYVRGKASVEAYLEQTAIANPHAEIVFIPPDKASSAEDADIAEGEQSSLLPHSSPASDSASSAVNDGSASVVRTTEHADRIIYPRAVGELPPETAEIKPHPYGVELGSFLRMIKQTEEKQLAGFFKNEFCRVPPATVSEIAKAASTKTLTLTGQTYISRVDHAAAERLYRALQDSKLRAPPTDCLAPIGVRTMLAGMLKGVKAEFYAASTRSPAVYRGNPFQIEAAIAFGGDLPGDQQARVIRFANRVPLLYQQSSCAAFKSIVETSWRNYGMSQPKGGAPVGPLVVMIHMASVWVPFTSESKEAIADYDDIRKEMRLALQECGRKLGTYVRRRQRMKRESEKRDVFERYIGEIAKSCEALTGAAAAEVYDALLKQAKRRTEIADAVLDEDGKIIAFADGNGRLDDDDGVIIVGPDGEPPSPPAGGTPAKPTTSRSDAEAPAPKRKPKRPAAAKPATKQPPTGKPRKKPRGHAPPGKKPSSADPTAPAPSHKSKPRMRLSPDGTLFEVA